MSITGSHILFHCLWMIKYEMVICACSKKCATHVEEFFQEQNKEKIMQIRTHCLESQIDSVARCR